MSKKMFWPLAMIIMGLIFLASNLGYLSAEFWNLWPVILIVVGLGGLITADQPDWLSRSKRSSLPSARSKTKRRK